MDTSNEILTQRIVMGVHGQKLNDLAVKMMKTFFDLEVADFD